MSTLKAKLTAYGYREEAERFEYLRVTVGEFASFDEASEFKASLPKSVHRRLYIVRHYESPACSVSSDVSVAAPTALDLFARLMRFLRKLGIEEVPVPATATNVLRHATPEEITEAFSLA